MLTKALAAAQITIWTRELITVCSSDNERDEQTEAPLPMMTLWLYGAWSASCLGLAARRSLGCNLGLLRGKLGSE